MAHKLLYWLVVNFTYGIHLRYCVTHVDMGIQYGEYVLSMMHMCITVKVGGSKKWKRTKI